ncbi:MAG TPA: glycoside hydrolase family 28 protein [Arachidicoccus sp.]|nr:glycoside hydrolase family 28 protein [Arachidicoccus sp.]
MRRIFILSITICLSLATYGQVSTHIFDIKNFGATGNGKTLDTDAINKAIEAAANAGGGTVFFPAGTYASYSIHLKSHVSLYLDQGAVLLAAEYVSGAGNYDAPEANLWGDLKYQDFGHSHFRNSLIWGENLEDISILGPGMINGKGLTRDTPKRIGEGNKAIALKLCRNVTLKDFTIYLGGHFGILATGVDNLTIENLKMDTNRDGMDIDCCHNVRIADCTINSPWDDAICLKSSYALGYARSTENITITGCQVSGFDLGTFLDGSFKKEQSALVPDHEGPTGRIKLGTESNGGFKNIAIGDCVFVHSRGLALETVDGALLEDITINNITMRDLTNSPFFLRLGARMRGPQDKKPGALRRVSISNVNVYDADSRFSSIIAGIPGYRVEDVSFNNIRIWYRPLDVADGKIHRQVPEFIKDYPEPQRFGIMPAYGFFIRHASGIQLNNVQIGVLGHELRPAVIAEDVNGLSLNSLNAKVHSDAPVLVLRDVNGLSIVPKGSIRRSKIKKEAIRPVVPDTAPGNVHYKNQ